MSDMKTDSTKPEVNAGDFIEYLSERIFDAGSFDTPMMYEVKCVIHRFIKAEYEKYTNGETDT